ncbi:MAG: XrtA system polysaccharide chain length determinant, partial [Pseudomonadota bacterium]
MVTYLHNLPRPIVRGLVGLWRRRWLIAGVAWLVAVAGWLATLAIPDMYESRAQVYINTDTALDSTISQVGARPNLEKWVRIVRTQILSRDNIEEVIYEVGLDAELDGSVALSRRIDRLSSAISVASEEQQYFVIRYADRDPELAQRVVAAVLDLFVEQNRSTAIADVDKALSSLNAEIRQRKQDLDGIDGEIAAFRRANAGELTGSSRMARRLEAKEEELGRLQDDLSALTVRRARVLGTLTTIPRYSSGAQVDQLKLELATLQSQFNDDYPDIVRIKAQIAELESGSSGLPTNPEYVQQRRTLRAIDDELEATRARETRVQTELDNLTMEAGDIPAAESTLSGLMRDREQVERTYKQLLKEQAEMDVFANLNEAGGAIQFRQFEAPKVAAEPSWPPRGLMTLAILIIALGAGASLAFLLTQLDKTYTQAVDMEEALGLPVLGTISPV